MHELLSWLKILDPDQSCRLRDASVRSETLEGSACVGHQCMRLATGLREKAIPTDTNVPTDLTHRHGSRPELLAYRFNWH
jgi:hypothetical protein